MDGNQTRRQTTLRLEFRTYIMIQNIISTNSPKEFIKDIITLTLLIGIPLGITYMIVGTFMSTPDRIVRQDKSWIYVVEHSLYDKDSSIVRYHQPISYDGVVLKHGSKMIGVPGKGGMTHQYVVIQYDYDKKLETQNDYFYSLDNGTKVKVIHYFYKYDYIEISHHDYKTSDVDNY